MVDSEKKSKKISREGEVALLSSNPTTAWYKCWIPKRIYYSLCFSSCLFVVSFAFLILFRVFEELHYDTEVDALEETDDMNITEASSAITIQRSVFATPTMVRTLS